MPHIKKRPGKRSGTLLFPLTPVMAVLLAGSPAMVAAVPVPVKATAKYDKKLDVLVISGKTDTKTVAANSRISAYDTANQNLLYTINTNSTGAFKVNLPGTGKGYVPCAVRLEMVNSKDNSTFKTLLPVAGNTACKTTVACAITSPAQDTEITAGASVSFAATPIKLKKGATPPDFIWKLGDGSQDIKSATSTHTFAHSGRYRVTMNAVEPGTGNTLCSDDVIVSVVPTAHNHNAVPELPKPGLGAALPKADGSNDENAYVVLPFEDMGMQGGSQVHLPYNPMINYNSLNAQAIQKLPHKPPLHSNTNIDVTYSAASNALDPIAQNSINSTSQNMFVSGAIGANWDLVSTIINPTTKLATDVKFISGQDFNQATVRKTEQWDRIHQPFAVATSIPETGSTFAERQNPFTPAYDGALPDEGVRGFVDLGTGTRKMPGAADPYVANDPQAFDFNSAQSAFVAQFIPATDIDDEGRTNPYPLMRVQAKDKGGETLATTDAVYTTASETRCRECHSPGGIAANEDVWRTPVTESELTSLTNPNAPGPATGAGSYDPGSDATKPWPPAIHNRFDNKQPENPSFNNLGVTLDNNLPVNATNLHTDPNGLRTDRVKASRWAKFDTATDKPTGETSPTKPDGAGAEWRLQVQLDFADASKYGDDSWVNQEKAALFNTLVMHDYMVLYGPTPAVGKLWPAGYSSQVADSYGDDVGKSRAQPMYFCSGHHQSHLKFDVGVNGGAGKYATNRSDYSRAFHAFHGKMQVYKQDVAAANSADGQAHKKGELIRDERGHPKMYGGRGWDSQLDDDNGIPLSKDANGGFTVKTVPAYDAKKNNWRPDLYPKDPNGESMLPFGEQVPVEENCAKCHTGPTEKSYRDIHHTAGLKCDNCHGDMLAVGNAFANEGYDANLTGGGVYGLDTADALEPADYRRPWLDEPDCGSCHIGDSNLKEGTPVGHAGHSHPLEGVFSAGVLSHAWMHEDNAKRSVTPLNARFAVMPTLEMRPDKSTVNGVTTYVNQPLSGALYRKSGDVHGSGANGALTCSTCHGGSHAIWPNQDPNANDNQTSKQLQGYDGNIAECSVCHVKDDFKTGLVATDGGTSNLGVGQGVRDGTVVTPASAKAYLAGPHGMHPVGDESWYKHAEGAAASAKPKPLNGGWHNDMAKKPGPDGEDQCAACHGADHKGTRLSKTLVDRTLTNEKGKPVKVVKGQVISCGLCHSVKKSFTGAPDPTSPTGGWPAPQLHAPPAPEPIVGNGGGGGGGH